MSIPRPNGPNVDIAPPMLATCWTLYTLAGAVVSLRIYTQLRVTRLFGTEDMVMILAVIFGFLHIIFLTASHHYGLGRHFFFLSDNERVMAMMYEFISEPFGILCSTFGRIASVLLMFRLFGTTHLRRKFLYSIIVVSFIVNLMTCITIYTQCKNVRSLWDPVGTPSKCWPPSVQADIGFFQGAVNSLTDLILTILPTTIFWTLQMKLRIKIGVVGLLGLSVFALGASIIKTVKLESIGDRSDYSYNTVSFMNWVVIENTFVMIAASIPLLRPLFNMAKDSAKTAISGYEQNPYEMNSRSQGTQSQGNVAYAYSNNPHKSILLPSSSEENILPMQNPRRDLENGVIAMETKFEVKYEKDRAMSGAVGVKKGGADK